MTDTARVLATAAVLSASAISVFAWRLARIDPTEPTRLIGELRLAQWAALLLAAVGAISIGLAVSRESPPSATVDVELGVAFVGVAAVVLHREPRDGLLLVSTSFVAHALVDIAHRPGWLQPDAAPRWYAVGSAVYDLCIAAACYWARRR